ncbi:MAG: hypothetical protein NTV80_13505 [Verrucomicrobia bacterium]|nr:hypothetical protein [Verrucomicrobiota bacterium]
MPRVIVDVLAWSSLFKGHGFRLFAKACYGVRVKDLILVCFEGDLDGTNLMERGWKLTGT